MVILPSYLSKLSEGITFELPSSFEEETEEPIAETNSDETEEAQEEDEEADETEAETVMFMMKNLSVLGMASTNENENE